MLRKVRLQLSLEVGLQHVIDTNWAIFNLQSHKGMGIINFDKITVPFNNLIKRFKKTKQMNNKTDHIKLNSIEEAIADIRAGKVVIVVDDEDRENEGDFIAAAEKVTPEMINFSYTW